MSHRDDALQEIVRLAREQGLGAEEIGAALSAAPASTVGAEATRQELLVRVLAFLGGTFVFAGIGVFIALQWDGMNSAARVVVTLGSGIAAFILAMVATREARFDRASTPFFLVAAALEPTGMFVAFDEYGSGGDWRLAALLVFGTMVLQFGAAFQSRRRSTLLFLVFLFGVSFWWSLLDLMEVDGALTALILGASMLLAAIGADRSGRGDITPVWYLFGAGAFLSGAFDAVEGTPMEILFLAAAAAFVYLAVAMRSRTLLFVSTLAILAYTGWFTGQHFAESIGWPLALIAFGLFMIVLSAAAYRIDRDYVRKR
jgi:hypothetical protein